MKTVNFKLAVFTTSFPYTDMMYWGVNADFATLTVFVLTYCIKLSFYEKKKT